MMYQTTSVATTSLLHFFLAATVAVTMTAATSTRNKYHKEDFLVQGLGDIEPAFDTFQGTMYSGLLPFTDDEQGKFMFWLFEPDETVAENTLGIYLSGGPGCSSIGTGNFFGTGPVGVPKFPAGQVDPTKNDAPLVANPYAWTKTTYMLYVEQPATTGFSVGPVPDDEDDVARDMYAFLVNFFDVFPHLQTRDLFLFGGSYSGMNVPALARKIYHENMSTTPVIRNNMNLKGMALGNAWLDAKIQGPAVIDYAWQHGMIDLKTRDTFHGYWNECMRGNKVRSPMHAFNIPDECGIDNIILQAAGSDLFEDQSPNCYDITTWDPYGVLGDHGTINKFYNNPAVQDALHTRHIHWQGCVEPGSMLQNDKPGSVLPYVAELLDKAGIRVIFYNGDLDLLCCHTGTDLLLNSMKWSNTTTWKAADRGVWMVNNRKAGYTKAVGNLTYVTVYNSGHMVYYNQPGRALDLITRFVKGESLLDVELPSYPRDPVPQRENLLGLRQITLGIVVGALLFLAVQHFKKRSEDNRKKDYQPINSISNNNSMVSYNTNNGNSN